VAVAAQVCQAVAVTDQRQLKVLPEPTMALPEIPLARQFKAAARAVTDQPHLVAAAGVMADLKLTQILQFTIPALLAAHPATLQAVQPGPQAVHSTAPLAQTARQRDPALAVAVEPQTAQQQKPEMVATAALPAAAAAAVEQD
jgi:hypothetical protein